MTLTSEQQRAVTRLGQDVCVVAGPGSGKTRVLVQRFVWLVESQKIDPGRILTITFTEKAAYEIRKRLAEMFADDAIRRSELERAPVSTIHGFCTRLLKENAIVAGIDPEFQILDERDSVLLLRESINESLNALLAADEQQLHALYESWAVPDPVAAFESAYEAVRLAGNGFPQLRNCSSKSPIVVIESALASEPANTPPRRAAVEAVRDWLLRAKNRASPADIELPRGYRGGLRDAIEEATIAWATQHFALPRVTLDFLLRDIDARYRARKRKESSLDFNDLEEFSIGLLESSATVRREVQSRFEHILMDEVQDTNPLQWKLMELVRREGRFFAVGDINQAIYGFRHARPDGFRDLRERVEKAGGAIDYLRENFRSREAILAAAEITVGAAEGIEPPQLVPGREFAPSDDPTVERFIVEHDSPVERVRLEAREICRRICAFIGTYIVDDRETQHRARFSDIALLFRTTYRFDEYEKEFQRAGIPYLMTGGKTLFERQEMFDLICWLRILANPRDEVALASVLRSGFVGVADSALLALRKPGQNLIESLQQSRDSQIQGFLDLLNAQRRQMDDVAPDLLVMRALDATGYEEGLDSAARANVRRLMEIVSERFTTHHEPMANLVEYLQSLKIHGEPNASVAMSPDAVQIMTIHAAKGLEFPIVFLPSLDLNPQSDSTGLIYSAETGLGAKWRVRPGEEVKDIAAHEFSEREKQRRKEESHRLLYVAMTRAEQKLILSSVQNKGGWVSRLAPIPVTFTVTGASELTAAASQLVPAPVVLVSRPKTPPQHDRAISATDIALFAHCPRRYFLDRYIGWQSFSSGADAEMPRREDDHGEIQASEFGRQVHALLAGLNPPGTLPAAMHLAARFNESSLGLRAARATDVLREYPFCMEVEGAILNGQIDLWFEDSEGDVLVDYKTDAVTADDASAAAVIYQPQIQIYSAAIARIRGRQPSRAVLYFLQANQIVDIKPDHPGAMRSTVRELLAAQASMQFPLREGVHCKRCPHVRAACPASGGTGQLDLFV